MNGGFVLEIEGEFFGGNTLKTCQRFTSYEEANSIGFFFQANGWEIDIIEVVF